MFRLAHYILIILLPATLLAQVDFDPDTVEFVKVSGPELAEIYKNDLQFDEDGRLWVATSIGLYTFDGYDWRGGWSQPSDPTQNVDQWLEGVAMDSSGVIWFASHSSGLQCIDPANGQITGFSAAEFTGQEIPDRLTPDLILSGDFLIAQSRYGFTRFNPYTGSYQDLHLPFPDEIDNPYNSINHYLPDSENPDIVWLGTKHGPLKYSLAKQEAQILNWSFRIPQQRNDQQVSVLDIHQNGDSLLIGTYGMGFVTYQKDLSRFHVDLIEPIQSTPATVAWPNVIQDFYVVDDTTMLFGSSRGAGVYSWSAGQYRFFNIPDVEGRSSTFRNIRIDHNGCVWVNNWSGVYRSRASLFPSDRESKLILTKCKAGNDFINHGYANSAKPVAKLREDQNTLELSFALANPVNPSAVRYAYRLQGVDRNWVENNDRRFVRYPNLGGGSYVFVVRATDGLGQQYERTLYRFEIHTPFYKRLWFIALISGVIMAVLYALFRQQISKVRLEERLNTEFDLKLSKMEMQALRSQMNPHFIFNSLNSIKNYVVNKGPDAAADYLTKFSQLIRVILENSKSELLTLAQEARALKLYIEIENMRFNHKFNFNLNIDPEIDQGNFKLPPMLIQPHVENAIWHGLMHKEGEGNLDVQFLALENGVLCIIEDNGIGRAQAAELAKSRRHKKQSLGTKITGDRIAMINKMYNTRVSTEIEDLKDEHQAPAGTRVKIFIENLNGK